MKVVPLTIRRCPATVHSALKKSAQANRRSLNSEALVWLERHSDETPTLTTRQLAARLRIAEKLLTPEERKEFAASIEEARRRMSHEHLH